MSTNRRKQQARARAAKERAARQARRERAAERSPRSHPGRGRPPAGRLAASASRWHARWQAAGATALQSRAAAANANKQLIYAYFGNKDHSSTPC
jgi:hypothetical protein